MISRAGIGLVVTTLALACGDDGGSGSGGSQGSTEADSSASAATDDADTADATSVGSATSASTGPEGTATTDPDDSGSGPPPVGTAGCGMLAVPGESAVEIQVGPNAREYLLVVPEGYDPDMPLPLVFAWHGLGGSSEIARAYFQIEAAAGGEAIFVYPQGLPVERLGGQTGWDLAPSGIDVQLFDAVLAEVSASLCVDPARVFSAGHSFGGYMTHALGCFRASVVRGVGVVAGGPPFGTCENDTVAAWLAHGTGDQVVPFSQGEDGRDAMLERNGCATTSASVDPPPCTAYDGCTDGMPTVWCAHDEPTLMGHAWPRFAGAGIWGFFEALPPKP